MNRAAAFFRWLGTPVRAARALFPFSREGRQTLVYLVFAGAGPALTVIGLRILEQAGSAGQWSVYQGQARIFGWSLLIVVVALGMFVSIRAVRIGTEGFSATGDTGDAVPTALEKSAQALEDKAAEIRRDGE